MAMSLSDHEKKLLAEMEEALSVDDPRLVSTLTGRGRTPQKSRILVGAAIMGLGLITLLGGLISQAIPFGILGFIVALSGVVLALSNFSKPKFGANFKGKKANQSGWSARLEERWDRRNYE